MKFGILAQLFVHNLCPSLSVTSCVTLFDTDYHSVFSRDRTKRAFTIAKHVVLTDLWKFAGDICLQELPARSANPIPQTLWGDKVSQIWSYHAGKYLCCKLIGSDLTTREMSLSGPLEQPRARWVHT